MSRLRIHPDVAVILDDEPSDAATAVVDSGPALYAARLPSGPIHVFGGSALTIWELLDGQTAEEVVAEVAAAYGLEPEAVRGDVLTHLDVLRRDGLIEDTE